MAKGSIVLGIVIALIIGGVAGYFGGQSIASPPRERVVTQTSTVTVTQPSGTPGERIVTQTVTATSTRIITSTVTQGPEAARPTRTITVAEGIPKTGLTIFMYAAQQLGYFKAEGLNVTVVQVQGTPTAMRGLLSGQVNIARANVEALGGVAVSDKSSKLFLATNKALVYVLVAKADYKSLSQLRGKSIGISALGGGDHGSFLHLLDREKIRSEDFTYVSLGGTRDRIAALVANKIDAAVLSFPDVPQIPDLGTKYVLLLDRIVSPFNACYCFVTKVSTIEQDQQMVLGFGRALIRFTRDLQHNSDFFRKAYASVFPEASSKEIEYLRERWTQLQTLGVNGGISVKELDEALGRYVAITNPDAKGKVSLRDILDTRVVSQALKDLGKDNAPWDQPDWQ